MTRLLTFSTLYPNACQPGHGIFVENRLRALAASGRVTVQVVAPVGYFPFSHPVFGTYGTLAGVPRREERFGVRVDHPRFLVIPKVGMAAAPWLLYQGARRHIARLLDAGQAFDLIDAHYFYPDGVAAAYLAREFGLPFVVTARGSDVTLLPRFPGPRRKILAAAALADGLVAVSRTLKDELVALGVAAERITVLRNGVDLDFFRPLPREAARKRWRLGRTTIASVGNLIPLKGHDLVIRAMVDIPEVELLVVGEGPERRRLEATARDSGLSDRVRFTGSLAHDELPSLYSAVDLTVLASSREGMANVLLESLACGTPVAATEVGGAPEVVSTPAAGLLFEARSVAAIGAGLRALLDDTPDREAVRSHAERFDWKPTTEGQIALFEGILKRRRMR